MSSGPLEETVRLGAVLLAGNGFIVAYSIGFGWGAVEVVYALFNGAVVLRLARRSDEKAVEARRQLQELGLMTEAGPFLGILERLSATALHIGSTLLVAKWPVFVLAAVPLHSAINLGVLALTRQGPLRVQAVVGPGRRISAGGGAGCLRPLLSCGRCPYLSCSTAVPASAACAAANRAIGTR